MQAEHYHTIMGVPRGKVDMDTLPGPIRLFGYIAFSLIGLGGLTIIILVIVQNIKS